MSIHTTHPFATPPGGRDPLRRLRGRLGGAVSVWTAGLGTRAGERAGLTVTSLLVADGAPGHVIGLVDADSDLADLLSPGAPLVVQLLHWSDQWLAEVFAGLAPSPGGMFTTGSWEMSEWGPRMTGRSWLGARVAEEPRPAGWPLLVDAVIEHIDLVDEDPDNPPLLHRRGTYQRG